jgi:hypothetical protein
LLWINQDAGHQPARGQEEAFENNSRPYDLSPVLGDNPPKEVRDHIVPLVTLIPELPLEMGNADVPSAAFSKTRKPSNVALASGSNFGVRRFTLGTPSNDVRHGRPRRCVIAVGRERPLEDDIAARDSRQLGGVTEARYNGCPRSVDQLG